MNDIEFYPSDAFSIGTEIELQIINPCDANLENKARELVKLSINSAYEKNIKPEITQSMIELNSSIHQNCTSLLEELGAIKSFLTKQCQQLNTLIAGGGTHPFQMWRDRHIFPAPRFRSLLHEYGYLAKRFTTFGQHIHIGCKNGDDAIYLTQALSRYLPHFIALSASSPFYQGVNSGFNSSRVNVVNAFPTSGFIPYLTNWHDFSDYIQNLYQVGIIKSIKDVYWDIRPKAEFGTVEVRIFDTPLSINTIVMLVAYTQALACYLINERPFEIAPYDTMLYNYNRYQASHYGFDGRFIDPYNSARKTLIQDDILNTIEAIKKYAKQFDSGPWLDKLWNDTKNKKNDTKLLQEIYDQEKSLAKVVKFQTKMWQQSKAYA